MISKEELTSAAKVFLQNPYWKRCYDEAPSDAAKQRTLLQFFWSLTSDESKCDEAIRQGKRLEEQFTLEDCKHALKYCGNNPQVAYWRRKIQELSK